MAIKKELHIVDVLAVSLSPEDAKTTAAIPGVLRVVPDKVTIKWDKKPLAPQSVPWRVDRIGADNVWTFNTGQGIKGSCKNKFGCTRRNTPIIEEPIVRFDCSWIIVITRNPKL